MCGKQVRRTMTYTPDEGMTDKQIESMTARGLVAEDMEKIAEFMYLTATQFETKADEIREGVSALCAKYPLYE